MNAFDNPVGIIHDRIILTDRNLSLESGVNTMFFQFARSIEC
jgi:hypothetical protein